MTPCDLQANLYQALRKGRLLVLFTILSLFLQSHLHVGPLHFVHLEARLVGLLVYHQTWLLKAHHVRFVVHQMVECPLAEEEVQARLVD